MIRVSCGDEFTIAATDGESVNVLSSFLDNDCVLIFGWERSGPVICVAVYVYHFICIKLIASCAYGASLTYHVCPT